MLPASLGAMRETVGAPRLTQGAYGSRGNLELVIPDAEDGLWVFWFNSDLEGDPPTVGPVRPGTWSDGIHVAGGRRYERAVIHQSRFGPDFLELFALTGGRLESWFWSPGPGFQRRGEVETSAGIRDVAAIEAVDGTLTLTLATDTDTGASRLTAETSAYPELSWTARSLSVDDATAISVATTMGGTVLATLDRGGTIRLDGHVLDTPGLAATCDLVSWGEGWLVVTEIGGRAFVRTADGDGWAALAIDRIDQGTLAACSSSRGGGTLELVWRSDGLRHLGIPVEELS